VKDPTSEQIVFSSICGRELIAVFDDHRVTSDGGALVLRGVDRQVGLIDALTDAIVDSPHPQTGENAVLPRRFFSLTGFSASLNMATYSPRQEGPEANAPR